VGLTPGGDSWTIEIRETTEVRENERKGGLNDSSLDGLT